MQKHYFELDKVESITLTLERESSYQWYPETPAPPKTFLGFLFGQQPLIPAGWNEYRDDDGNECRLWNRKQSTYFADYSWYRIDEVNKKIYNKAHVTVYLSYKHSLGTNFESNEEAQEYVDSLIEDSDKGFHVIINN
jgi:hypothetical protein